MNLDQTGVPFVPAPQYLWAQTGAKDVSVNGFGEKRQITVIPTTTVSGASLPLQVCSHVGLLKADCLCSVAATSVCLLLIRSDSVCCCLPLRGMVVNMAHNGRYSGQFLTKSVKPAMQVIFQGSSTRSLPALMKRTRTRFCGWLWGFTDNHWSNLHESKKLFRLVLLPYVRRTIEKLSLPRGQKALVLLDFWPVHISKAFRARCPAECPELLMLYVPPNTTSKLQPQDKFYNKPFKCGTKEAFCDHQVKMF